MTITKHVTTVQSFPVALSRLPVPSQLQKCGVGKSHTQPDWLQTIKPPRPSFFGELAE